MALSASTDNDKRLRTTLAGSATGVAIGIAIAVLDYPTLSAFVTVGSLLVLIYSVHGYGRSGADAPRARRRKRKAR